MGTVATEETHGRERPHQPHKHLGRGAGNSLASNHLPYNTNNKSIPNSARKTGERYAEYKHRGEDGLTVTLPSLPPSLPTPSRLSSYLLNLVVSTAPLLPPLAHALTSPPASRASVSGSPRARSGLRRSSPPPRRRRCPPSRCRRCCACACAAPASRLQGVFA